MTRMTHQKGLNTAAKIAGAFPDHPVTLNLRPPERTYHADVTSAVRPPYAEVVLEVAGVKDLDELQAIQAELRSLGYAPKYDSGGYFEVKLP